jgi:hypothetical protein
MLEAKGVEQGEFLEYKGRPLVRQDNEIYYGDLSEKYYIYMMIMSEKESQGGAVPDKIMIQLLDSATKMPADNKQKIAKGFAEAFEFADAWLARYNK